MGEPGRATRPETLLVIGVHREELAFGDRVAGLLDSALIDVLRIPQGIPQAHTGTDGGFYSDTQHREIYLQLRQQVKGRYRLLIDLHSGLDENGRCADVFCRDERFLGCLAALGTGGTSRVRLIKIVASDQPTAAPTLSDIIEADARTRIPRKIWDDDNCLYVGLEVYLADDGAGTPADWRLARELIGKLQTCASAQET